MINQEKAKEAYDLLIQKAKEDDRILGVILSGGRGKGVQSENSDYDVMLITSDEGFEAVKKDYPKTEFIDPLPHVISEFKDYAKAGTPAEYDKYTFAHNKAIIDKTGEIQKLIDEKGVLSSDEASSLAKEILDGYLNSLHRSLKNLRDGNILAGHLDATESLPLVLTFIFAFEGRVKPYNKFLKWELDNFPLLKLPIETSDFLKKLENIARDGDIENQKELFAIIKKMAIDNGLGEVIAGWDGYYFG